MLYLTTFIVNKIDQNISVNSVFVLKSHLTSASQCMMAIWLSDKALALMNIVALRRTRLILGWVTVLGYLAWYLAKPPRPIQPGHPSRVSAISTGDREETASSA